MTKKHKVLLTVLVVGLGGALAGFGVFSAFSSTTDNPGNTFAAGTVAISDNDGDSALFSTANAKPGDYDKCVKVTYSGSLDAQVKLYASSISADGSKVNVTINKGTGDQADCSDFVDGGSVYASTTLSAFGTSHSGWANGLAVNPGAASNWVQNDALTFRVRVTVPDNNASQGANITAFKLTWEAQNL